MRLHFYEKVIKVKADVAAFLINCFPSASPSGGGGGGWVRGPPLTLDSSPRHLHSSWERSVTQFSWASFLSGFGFQFVLHAFGNASELCLPRSFPFVPRSTLDRRFVPLRFSTACLLTTHSYPASIRTLKEPHGARCTLGFDLKPGPITSVTGPGWLGAAI
jgi:hypothetical protein